jgi:hypothetical protein
MMNNVDHGGLWFISKNGKRVLGTNRERLAFFQAQPGMTAPWHGYPVSGQRPNGVEEKPSEAILDSWSTSKLIDRAVRDKIMRGILR